MLESAFAAFYRRIAGDEVFDEENVPHVLEAWGKTIEAFSGNAFSAFHPHLDDASLFFETALRIREGIKRYRLCPFCRTVHLTDAEEKADDTRFSSCPFCQFRYLSENAFRPK